MQTWEGSAMSAIKVAKRSPHETSFSGGGVKIWWTEWLLIKPQNMRTSNFVSNLIVFSTCVSAFAMQRSAERNNDNNIRW
jgi:hypothetical protein